MKKIIDQFSDLPVSREYKRQLRKNAAGLCRVAACKRKAARGGMCAKCVSTHRDQQREKYRLAVGIPADAPLWTHGLRHTR